MYVINIHHRNGNVAKSQWKILESDEISCFDSAKNHGWVLDVKGWGLHFVSQKPNWLGVAQDQTTQLFIAKFVGSSSSGEWHGYPADYRNNHHDIPAPEILQKWLSGGSLSAPKVRKIAKGQPCNL